MNSMENPYIPGGPVKDPGMFFGREDTLTRIFKDIGRKQMQSHCIIGERRIGKTSLLNQVMCNEVQERYIKGVESIVFVKTDITLFPDASPSVLFEKWSKDIFKISGQALSTEPGYLSFRGLVENVTETGYRIIILLDEFEATAEYSNLNRGFFEFLRALTQNYDISFVLFSRIPLQFLMKKEKFSSRFSSPFFNTLNISYLKFLRESTSKRLIAEPSQKVGTDISNFTEFILEQAYYHPYLLQQLCHIVFDHKKSSDTDHEKIMEEFKTETEVFFTYLWQHSDSNEREVLKKLVSKEKDIPRKSLDNLDRRSILTEDRSKIFCPLFEEFIKRKI